MNARLFRMLSAGAMLAMALGSATPVRADTVGPIDFESYTLGTVNGQDGWSSTGAAGSGCATYDHAVAAVGGFWAVPGFGSNTLRISNAVTSGCFGDHTFSKSLANEVGETATQSTVLSGGTRQTRFDASWEFASAVPGAEQAGLSVTASPDRGDGARMSWVQMADTPTGLEVNFYDYQDRPPYGDGVTPANGCTGSDDWYLTNVASGLARNVKHSIRIVMDLIDGPRNDVVQIYVDGVLKHTGTSWEDYFRFCNEPVHLPYPDLSVTVDSILFRTGGTAAPATAGFGFLIDNLSLVSSIPPACTTDCYVDDATGNDAFGGASPANAKKTIQAAINQVNVGGTVHVAAGTYNEDVNANKANVTLQGAGIDVSTIVGPIGGSGATVYVTAGGVVIDGFTVTRAGNNPVDWNNPGLNSGGVSVQGLGSNVELRNSKLVGNRTGVDINNSNGNSIHNNIIDNNRTGMIFRNQTDNTSVMNNFVTNNWTVGILFLDGSGGTNIPPQSALNSTFSNNKISGNWYGQIVDRQIGGAIPAPGANLKNFSGNWYGTTAPVYSTANSAEPGYAAQIPVIYGGAAVPPGGQPDILGPASANFDFTPYLATGTDTAPANGFQGDFSSLYVTAVAGQTGATARVQEGVDAVTPAGTVRVVAGSYAGDTLVAKALNLYGAKQGVAVGGRTFGGPAESTLSGMLTIQAAGVTVDGFSETNVVPSGGVIGFLVKTAGTNAVIANNIFDTISTPDVSATGIAQAIYLDNGPDGVQILNNAIRNVTSDRSAKGILIGDSASSDPSQNVVIQGNRISNIASTTRGGYGILVGNLAGASNLQVVGNVIDSLSSASGWVHAIGLERNTPNVSVNHNVISNLSAPGPDKVAVWFESNPSFATALVNRNSLAVGPAVAGILLHPALVGGPVNGSCNWWGDPTGPSGAGAGIGSPVGAGITFSPWLGSAALDGGCPPADLYFNPAAAMVASGGSVGVDLNLAGVSDLYGYQFQVSFPAAMGTGTGSFVNTFFDTTSNTSIPPGWNATCSAGQCLFAASKFAPGTSVTGSGTLGHINFVGGTPGVYTVSYQGALLSDSNAQPLAAITRTAVITVYGQATVSGIVKLQGRATPVTLGSVTLTDTSGLFPPVNTTFDATTGAYLATVPALAGGTTYTLTVDHTLYLSNQKLQLVMPGNAYPQATQTLRAGDANNDEMVSITDLSCVGGDFGGVPTLCAPLPNSSDINADGIVNIFDLVLVGGNFDKVSPQAWQ